MQRNEVAISAAHNFNNDWPLYLNLSIKNLKCQREKRADKKHKFSIF